MKNSYIPYLKKAEIVTIENGGVHTPRKSLLDYSIERNTRETSKSVDPLYVQLLPVATLSNSDKAHA